ncbi:MAG: hypothetical protein AAB113_03135 [Candidatus Eisenbacteria bacterium]
MGWDVLAGGCLVIAVALLLFLGIFRAKVLLGAALLLPAANRRPIRRFLVANLTLMVVFFSGSLMVTFSFLTGSATEGMVPVSLTLLAGSLMVLLSTILQTRMILGLQKTLSGVVPVCSGCKRIRRPDSAEDDPAAWQVVDAYLAGHTAAVVTHGLCPDCLQRLYPEMAMGPAAGPRADAGA